MSRLQYKSRYSRLFASVCSIPDVNFITSLNVTIVYRSNIYVGIDCVQGQCLKSKVCNVSLSSWEITCHFLLFYNHVHHTSMNRTVCMPIV